jgi:MFS family permease
LLSLKKRPYWGYWIVVAVFWQWLMATGIVFYSYSLFFPRWQDELGWSLTQINAAQSLLVLSAVVGPIVGRLADVRGPRLLLILSVPLMSLSIFLRGAMTEVWHLWAITLLQVLGSTAPWVATPKLIGFWFQKTRGRMMGIALMGNNIGGLVMAPLTGVLIEALGWRETLYLVGAVMLVVNFPIAFLLIRDRAEFVAAEVARTGREWEFQAATAKGAAQAVSRAAQRGWTVRNALTARSFWLATIALFTGTVSMVAVVWQLGNHLQIVGIDIAAAGIIAGIMGGFGGIGKVAFGALTEKVPVRYVVAVCLALQLIGLLLLLQLSGPGQWWLLVPFVVLYGLGFGAIGALQSLFLMELFGLASFGAIFGLSNAVSAVGQAGIPAAVGRIVDLTGTYETVFVAVLGILAVGLLASLLARPQTTPAPREPAPTPARATP